MDSVTYGMAQVRKARAALEAHVANPASTCICCKCEAARKV